MTANIVSDLELCAAKFRFRVSRRYAAQSRHIILVNGAPKSGTTWMWRMLAAIPGYRMVPNFKGQVERYIETRPGDVIHGHQWLTPAFRDTVTTKQIAVILMVRDPRDQTVSRMHHIRRDVDHPWHEKMNQVNEDEALMLTITGSDARDGLPRLPGVQAWGKFTKEWLESDAMSVEIRYEDLLLGPNSELKRLLGVLQMNLPDDLVDAIVSRHRFERLSAGRKFWAGGRKPGRDDPASHFRKGISGDWKNVFKPEHKRAFKDLSGDLLVELGYESGFGW